MLTKIYLKTMNVIDNVWAYFMNISTNAHICFIN